MTVEKVTASLTAENTFTDSVILQGPFNLNISNTWVGTITVQRKFPDSGGAWLDVPSGVFTANTDSIGNEVEYGVLYRAGFKTGDFGSGQADVRLSK